MLRQKDLTLQSQAQAQLLQQQQSQRLYSQLPSRRSPLLMSLSPKTAGRPSLANFGALDYNQSSGYPVQHVDPSALSSNPYFHHTPDHDNLRHHRCGSSASVSSLGASGTLCCSHTSSNPSPPTTDISLPGRDTDLLRDLFWPSWPARLPTPELLQHLYDVPIYPSGSPELIVFLVYSVDVFFSCLPHATRVVHKESFLQALSLPPTAGGFPETSILHAICAVASLFTSAVSAPPVASLSEHAPALVTAMFVTHPPKADDLFHEKYGQLESRDHSFGDMQAKYAKEAQEEATKVGEGVFAGLQCKSLCYCRSLPLQTSLTFTSRGDLELVLSLPC